MKNRNIIFMLLISFVLLLVVCTKEKSQGGSSAKNVYARGTHSNTDEKKEIPKSELGDDGLSIHEAMFYKKMPDNLVRCQLCPFKCVLRPGERGICRIRKNVNGKLIALTYSVPCSINNDPIEKKPLFHFLPGTDIFSIATAGCNLRCQFCQNWEISQNKPEDLYRYYLPPEMVVENAIKYHAKSIAYTYSEPLVFYEYVYDTAKLAHQKGLKNVLVTAGYINEEPLRELCKYIDAVNLDIKGFTDEYYNTIIGGDLEVVLTSAKIFKQEGVWLEITNLMVPTLNDNPDDIRKLCKWIKENLGPDTPVHFSRFSPRYKLKNLPPTPVKTLETALKIAKEEGLNFVYIGNVVHQSESTFCPQCGELLIERKGYFTTITGVDDNFKCKQCGYKLPGVFETSKQEK